MQNSHYIILYLLIIRSTSESVDFRIFFPSHLHEIRYIGTGRWVMHDGMRYGRIEGQGQGHEPFKVW